MKTSPLDREIRSRIDSFLGEITSLVRHSTLEAVYGALGGPDTAPARRGPGRPRKNGATAVASRVGKRVKRTSESVMETASTVLSYIKANAGQRLEEISRGLGIASKELKLPIQKLFEARSIKTTGAKRGTRYFAGGGGGGSAKKRGAKKKVGKRRVVKKSRRGGRKARAKAVLVPVKKRLPASVVGSAAPEVREAVSAA